MEALAAWQKAQTTMLIAGVRNAQHIRHGGRALRAAPAVMRVHGDAQQMHGLEPQACIGFGLERLQLDQLERNGKHRWLNTLQVSGRGRTLEPRKRCLRTRCEPLHSVECRCDSLLTMNEASAFALIQRWRRRLTPRTRRLTLELSCLLRQTVPGRGREDATGPWSGQATAAVAGQLERRVRPRRG